MANANRSSSSSSSSEEGEGSSSSHSSSNSNQETAPPKNTPITAPASTPLPSHESQVHSRLPNVKPSATKPMVETSKTKTTVVSSVKTSAKRPSEPHLESAKPKRHNKKVSVAVAPEEANKGIDPEEANKGVEEDANKQQFQRVFSEEDEIALLKGMFDYSVEKGADASVAMNGFYDFIKKSIHAEVTKTQLSDKIKRLKKRFKNNQGRTFKHPSHEQQIFELSKKIWGKEAMKGKELSASLVKNVGLGKNGLTLFERMNAVAGLEAGNEIINFGSDMIEGESRTAFEKDLLKFQIAEVELLLQHNELMNKKMKFILDNFKSQL